MNKWVYFGVWSLWVPGFHRRICTLIRIGAECHLDGMDYHLWSEFYFMMHIIICGRRLFSVRIWRAWKVKRMDPWRDLVHLNFNWDWLNDAERDKKPGNVKTVSLCVCERNNNIAIGHEHTAESWDSGTLHDEFQMKRYTHPIPMSARERRMGSIVFRREFTYFACVLFFGKPLICAADNKLNVVRNSCAMRGYDARTDWQK